MKKRILFMIFVMMLSMITFTGCGEKNDTKVDEQVPDTVAYKLREQFRTEIVSSKDIANVAEKLTNSPEFEGFAMTTMPVEEGYLNGFNEEIKGFKSGVMFAPMIGSVPFVGYVFEADDPEALAKILDEKSMLNWNVCTIADEKVVDIQGNYVFFVMAPTSFEMD